MGKNPSYDKYYRKNREKIIRKNREWQEANKKKVKYAVSFTKTSLIQYANSALKMPYSNV